LTIRFGNGKQNKKRLVESKRLEMKDLGRLITAMVTPFDAKGKVDYKQAEKLALALLKSGSDGLVLSGTTGESPTLTHDEELKLYADIKKVVGKRGSIIAGTGSNSTAEAVEATQAAEKAGVDACLLVAPYYNKPTQDGLYMHFKTIAEKTKLPCILYNVPSRTVVSIASETVIKLSQIKNIIGIKEASGNMEEIGKIIAGTRKDFIVWSGNDSDTLPLMSIGGYGIISVASHLVGLQIKDMINKFLAGQNAEAAAVHLNLMPLMKVLFIVSNPVPVKYALNQIGFNVGQPRLPLVEPDAKSAAQIKDVLKNYTIDLPLS
jgi:4-hydroxy-tetrahydrodipicolinate synthase